MLCLQKVMCLFSRELSFLPTSNNFFFASLLNWGQLLTHCILEVIRQASYPVHCYMFEVSICHFRGVGSIFSLFFYF